MTSGFNPRTRTGCDAETLDKVCESIQVSIHAPARGATMMQMLQSMAGQGFNPRTRTGCDAEVVLLGQGR